ncbi:hypothetical protein KUTeg_013888 [Tegillarca granosa]|uniref:Uncharacterized protein n=1 Tax=Tegillarca granosa TaxID=220873 RepID=A0ABQ9EVD7_TEGGR|nr:hypothetical protein KUTeg_013888 [Tegillarca granosa]
MIFPIVHSNLDVHLFDSHAMVLHGREDLTFSQGNAITNIIFLQFLMTWSDQEFNFKKLPTVPYSLPALSTQYIVKFLFECTSAEATPSIAFNTPLIVNLERP